MNRQQLEYWAQFIRDLCLIAGSEVSTAYICAHLFIFGLERNAEVSSLFPLAAFDAARQAGQG